MRVEVHIVQAFIDGGVGGNPAGVVLNADALTPAQKLSIAGQVGLSETAFVSSSQKATFRLEFFTPTRQIAHCGHATIATFSLLRQLGAIGDGRYSKETVDGNRDILLDGDTAFMEQTAPTYRPIDPASDLGARIAKSMGLSPGLFTGGLDPHVVSTGNRFLLVALPDARALADLSPLQDQVHAISDELDLIGVYAFTTETQRPGRHAGARMFAPRFGIPEEAGTGMAAGPLACLLHDVLGVQDRELLIEQGWLMQPPSPSLIRVVLEREDGRITGLMAGGTGRISRSMVLEV
jgi:PhzF family phenazine biosynthesis protein